MYDLIIVGSGPAGLAAALSSANVGLDCLVLERASVASTIEAYPINRVLFSSPDEVELERRALKPGSRPTREEVLDHYRSVASRGNINIRTHEAVERVAPYGDGFSVVSQGGRYYARSVLLALGGFGRPRTLGVPGESKERLSYSFVEASPYTARPVLVIGGGNSGAEASIDLADAGARVTLSFRRSSLESDEPDSDPIQTSKTPTAKIKPWVREPLYRAISKGQVRMIPGSRLKEILPRSAILIARHGGSEEEIEVECDHIFALIGAEPDTTLLEDAGADLAADGRPVYDVDTYETTVPGLYVAGHITRDLHMKNAVPAARRVVNSIASRVFGNKTDTNN